MPHFLATVIATATTATTATAATAATAAAATAAAAAAAAAISLSRRVGESTMSYRHEHNGKIKGTTARNVT